jgi:glycosyltransferase involved in cell wall biosynthesis
MNLPSLAVVVPSYRRPDMLEKCLDGLAAQDDAPDEIVAVHRVDDHDTIAVIDRATKVRPVAVTLPGVIAAMMAGAAATTAEVIAFIDDDAYAHTDWVFRLRRSFVDSSVGVIGGRDLLEGYDDPPATHVGMLSWYGRLVGNHHCGAGEARDIDVAKAVNMAVRRAALAFPTGLRGSGAQVHHEVATCLWAKSRGWRVRYDPSILVDHNHGPRFDPDQRMRPAPEALFDMSYNLIAATVVNGQRRWPVVALYGCLMGDKASPGLGRGLIGLAQGRRDVAQRMAPSIKGRVAALRSGDGRRGIEMRPVSGGHEPANVSR